MMEGLLAGAAVEMQALVDRVAAVETQKTEVLLRFGEDPKSGDIQELFQTVSTFCSKFMAANGFSSLPFVAFPCSAVGP